MFSFSSLRQAAQAALVCQHADQKVQMTLALDDTLPLCITEVLQPKVGRPAFPALVHPRDVPTRGVGDVVGRGMLLHALAHIEFNAINLALDLIVRFENQPYLFYWDWLTVAKEEALHHRLLCERLSSYGLKYGDYPGHDGLWQVAEKTKGSLLARLALVPRLLEARGLDVSPAIRDKLLAAGDVESADVLRVILNDEIGHVAIGNRWFNFLCEQDGLNPLATFEGCLVDYCAPTPRSPFNFSARELAGFSEDELAWLKQLELEQQVAKRAS